MAVFIECKAFIRQHSFSEKNEWDKELRFDCSMMAVIQMFASVDEMGMVTEKREIMIFWACPCLKLKTKIKSQVINLQMLMILCSVLCN